ncbi:App1 family protein [Thalassococcus sp. S3]|uniref:App1 family protein n=1 Tax=Thalassococcus sp. S3 TaxID=2017482 RepID=UPI0010242353|nr:phosphatase domain-containing protein [Thalassococcus sp. S3]QBF32643.1 acyl-CoA synthetase [Thalassococcus sp. S3]
MLKPILHRLALRAERFAEGMGRLRGQAPKGREVDPHIGFATPEHLIARGRVLARIDRSAVREGQGRWANLRQMVRLFLTDEVADVELRHGAVTGRSDEEGYFQLLLPRDEKTGWREVELEVEGREGHVSCPIFVPRQDADFMVISDIDDTMMQTGAYSLLRNLWTSFTGNANTRHIFADAVELMELLSDEGRNPIFYVSSSPWNMHRFLVDVFDRAGLVKGPMFLRDLGLSETKFITDGHGNHKGQSIDLLLRANPDLPAILIGDTGQKDAAIYREAVLRHPEQIRAVMLRAPGPGLDARDERDLDALRKTGIFVFAGPDFDGADPRQALLAGTHQRSSARKEA